MTSTFQKFRLHRLLIIVLNAGNYQPEKNDLVKQGEKKLGYFKVTFGKINLSKTGSNLEVWVAHMSS